MSEALPYTRRTRIPRVLGVKNYLNNYFTVCKRLTRSRIHDELASPLPLLGIRNYLNTYFAMYKRLTHSRIRVELASPVYMGL